MSFLFRQNQDSGKDRMDASHRIRTPEEAGECHTPRYMPGLAFPVKMHVLPTYIMAAFFFLCLTCHLLLSANSRPGQPAFKTQTSEKQR